MNKCLYIEDQKQCDYYDPEKLNSRRECWWHTYGVLDHPICKCPYHGMSKEIVQKMKEGVK